ncbi:hypothetical protein [Streptomyces venezuelae]|uniref:hypothetical protein n=1 Tax=Streptomyces venezuelae TaxID=54571 RepID=UPI001681592B|nr:hypothetical protein [Streptomyces venezuelae]
MKRPDLLALDADTLAALANRGLVKRAAKELDGGAGAVPELAADATLTGRFPDGTETVLPPGTGLDGGSCTCGAPGLCRHLVGLVLSYQHHHTSPADAQDHAQVPAPAPDPEAESGTAGSGTAGSGTGGAGHPAGLPWSPADVGDEALTVAVGARALAAARRTLRRGYTARLHHPTAAEPVPRAELATCTVRFPVPGALGYALTDTADDRRGEAIALAVWAFRAAAAASPADPSVQLRVGGAAGPALARARTALAAALDLAEELLLDGAAHAGPVLDAALRGARDTLAAHGLHWPADALDELTGLLADYTARGARYRPERHAHLIAELHARHRAALHEGATPASPVLGTGEPGSTPLRRVRLTALGCRISGGARERTAQVYFAHGGAGVALVLNRRWELPPDGPRPVGHELAGRRIAGAPLAALAAANVVSENASRTAGGTVTLGTGRLAGTGVTPVGSAWAELPEPLLVRDFAAHTERLRRLPPPLIRPRVAADAVRVVAVHAVEDLGYHPAEQRLEATVRDAHGCPATLAAPYNPYGPGGLDALAAALEPGDGGVRLVSAFVRAAPRGGLLIDPIAVLTPGGVVVPDLAAGSGSQDPGPAGPPPAGPIADALGAALAALALAAHRGLRHLGAGERDRLAESAAALARTGLSTAAGRIRALLRALAGDTHRAAATAWVDAQLYVLTAAELSDQDAAGGAPERRAR